MSTHEASGCITEADATPDDEAPCDFLLPVWYCRFLARGRDRLKGFVVVVFWAGVPTRRRRLLLFSTWGWLPFNCGLHCCCFVFVARFLVVVPSMISEPGFLKFHIFRFSILEFFFWEHIFETYVGEISRNK